MMKPPAHKPSAPARVRSMGGRIKYVWDAKPPYWTARYREHIVTAYTEGEAAEKLLSGLDKA